MKRAQATVIATIILALAGGVAPAEEPPPADDEMREVQHLRFYHGANARYDAKLTVYPGDGGEVVSQMVLFRLDIDDEDDGDQNLLGFFTEGPRKGGSLLVHKHARARDEGWVFDPQQGEPSEVRADARTPFFGSHLYWEDLVGRPLDADKHVLENRALTYDTVRSTPRDPGSVDFDSYTTKIHRTRKAPVLVRYFKNGEVIREIETRGLHRIQGNYTLIWIEVRDLVSGGSTELYLDSTEYDLAGVEPGLFAVETLREPPLDLMP